MGLLAIPEISVTPAPDGSSLQDSPVCANYVSFIHGPRLVVPPHPDDCPSRRSLAQRGLRIGSFRLNCAESFTNKPASPILERPPTDLASTRRVFNWSRTSTLAQASVPPTTRSHRGHSRAKSLNSFAEVSDSLKINIGAPRHSNRDIIDSRTMSIDLSVLCARPNSPTCHAFASAL